MDLHALLDGLLQFRHPELRARKVLVTKEFAPDTVVVLGSQGQLEQVFLNLLIHAEQSEAPLSQKTIQLTTSIIGRRVMVDMTFSQDHQPGPVLNPLEQHPGSDSLGLGVCRAVVQNHGGELRFLQPRSDLSRFEVELPLLSASLAAPTPLPRWGSRPLTMLLVEPDALLQKEFLGLMGARGHRVVPVTSAAEAVELVPRVGFDLVFCSVRLPGSSWSELQDRVRDHVAGFVLLNEAFDSDLARSVYQHHGFLLVRPIQPEALDQLWEWAEPRLGTRSVSVMSS